MKNTQFYTSLSQGPMSIISNDCFGGFVYKKFGLEYTTPFIWLWLDNYDYIKLLKNLKYYLNCKLNFIKQEGISYPVGLLDDIKIHFNHYSTEYEAEQKWYKRLERFNWNNIVIKYQTTNEECIYEFDKLEYINKVVFVPEEVKVESGIGIPGWKDKTPFNGVLLNMIIEEYKYFDWMNWFFVRLSEEQKRQVLFNFRNIININKYTNQNIILFGASKGGQDFYNIISDMDTEVNITYFCDNDPNKWGSRVNGIEVISPLELQSKYNSRDQIVITSMYDEQIKKQLLDINDKFIIKSKYDFILTIVLKDQSWFS